MMFSSRENTLRASVSHRLIRLHPRSLTLSGLPIHVARIPAAPFPRAPFSFSLGLGEYWLPIHMGFGRCLRRRLPSLFQSSLGVSRAANPLSIRDSSLLVT